MGRYSAKMFALCGVRPKFGALLSDVKRFFTYVQNDARHKQILRWRSEWLPKNRHEEMCDAGARVLTRRTFGRYDDVKKFFAFAQNDKRTKGAQNDGKIQIIFGRFQ